MNDNVTVVADCRCVLGEGPLWNPALRQLFWTDIEAGQIWRYTPETGRAEIALTYDGKIGGFAFTADQALVLCTDKGVDRLDSFASAPRRLFDIPLRPAERFNDITTDPLGRIFAGTVEHGTQNGKLYRLERGCAPQVVLDGIACSNGMTFSLDETVFYHTDSHVHRITRYAYDRATGALSAPSVFFQGTPEQGYPDGLTIDRDGTLWCAFWGAACVRRLAPDGAILREVALPVKQPTSVMFGGAELADLYITSAAIGAEEGLGGPLFRLRTDTRGRAEWPARV